jgi:hypothetical protein
MVQLSVSNRLYARVSRCEETTKELEINAEPNTRGFGRRWRDQPQRVAAQGIRVHGPEAPIASVACTRALNTRRMRQEKLIYALPARASRCLHRRQQNSVRKWAGKAKRPSTLRYRALLMLDEAWRRLRRRSRPFRCFSVEMPEDSGLSFRCQGNVAICRGRGSLAPSYQRRIWPAAEQASSSWRWRSPYGGRRASPSSFLLPCRHARAGR